MSQSSLPPEVAQMLPIKGHVFEGKYRIVELSGAGGFARVYRARFEDVGRDVALKILVPQSANPMQMYPDELVERFHREARAVSHLKSPSTITLHDFGRTPHGLLYMIFEFVDGTSVNRLVKGGGPIAPDRLPHILRQILHSLREAHAVGILHRDIKPANIMLFDYLDQRDIVKVLDFGIAKQTHSADGHPIANDLTEAGAVMGTPRYMSPEQIIGQELTPATDIYSLGLVAYEMLVGTPAAAETEKSAIVRRHLGPEPIELPGNVHIPPGLRAIIAKMMAKSVADRFHDAGEVLRALDQYEQQQSSNASTSNETQAAWFGQEGHSELDMADTQKGMANPGMASHQFAAPSTGVAVHAPHHTAQQQNFAQNTASGPSAGYVGATQAASMTGFGNGAPQGFGAQQIPAGFGNSAPGGPPTATMGQAGATGQMIQKPAKTFLQVRATPETFEVDVPMKPSQRGFLAMGVTGVIFVIAYIATSFFWLLTLAPFAWAASLVFRTYSLSIRTDTGYELLMSFFVYDKPQRGPMASVVRFEAVGSDTDDNTVLKLVTHEGDFIVANAFSDAENRWVAHEGNQWLQHVRARNPNPLG